jgi:hypothetical protein
MVISMQRLQTFQEDNSSLKRKNEVTKSTVTKKIKC